MSVVIDGEAKFGRWLEDFEIGMVIHHWPGKTLTESDNNLFSLLTMNHHPIHLDHEYSKKHQHGQVLVVGTLVLSVVVGMSVADISGKAIANLEYEYIRHEGPVFIGDTLYAATEILDISRSKTKPDRGIVYVETKSTNQNGGQVLSLRRKVLLPCQAVSE